MISDGKDCRLGPLGQKEVIRVISPVIRVIRVIRVIN